jgi:hypothetical protein
VIPPETHRASGASRILVPLLAVASVLLLLTGFGVLAAARGSLADQDAKLAVLRRQQSADASRSVPPAELPRPTLNLAALRDRLAAVTAADRDVDASVKKWVESDAKLSTVWDALERCMYRVDQYDRLAGRFSAAELGDLPVTLDTNAAATDCGRAAITKYAAGSSL